MIEKVSRRDFVAIGSGLVLGFYLPRGGAAAASAAERKPGGRSARRSTLGAFIEIGTDNIVTVYVPKTEMGQGVHTSLAMIVAEELDADWDRVRVGAIDLDPKYGDQGTGGSGSVWSSWTPLRQAGAAARAMLVAAAAAHWGVDPKEILGVRKGVITYSDIDITFGEVAEAAGKLPVPKDVALKDPASFTLIGTSKLRLGGPDIVRGKATYGIDVRVPGMLYAAVARCPVFGGSVASYDAAKAKAMKGVRHVVQLDASGAGMPWAGVAVVADSTWAALQGRDALAIKWDEGPNAKENSEDLGKALSAALDKTTPTTRFRNDGDVEAIFKQVSWKVEAEYEVPFLAHATLEPQNATAHVTEQGAEIWAPTQFPGSVARAVAAALKLKPEQVKVHVTLAGGGFGRRINSDYAVEAALLAKAAGAPVHVQWTREDDLQHDFYRPASKHKIEAMLGGGGQPLAYWHRIASPSIRGYYRGPSAAGLDESETEGVSNFYHDVANVRGDYFYVPSAVPRGWWRSVATSANCFAVQSFMDELANAMRRDPIAMQLALIGDTKVIESKDPEEKAFPYRALRMWRVIELARDQSGWGKPLPARHALGFACQYAFLTYVAQVAEISVDRGAWKVERVTCAVDCGTVVDLEGAIAQIRSGILFGLNAAMSGAITIKDGRVEQSNFHDYPLLRINEAPQINVHFIPSAEPPTGLGEPGVPPIAPAVANAVFKGTGRRLRKLPFALQSS